MDWDGGVKGDEFWVMEDGGDLGTEEDQVDREYGSRTVVGNPR